MVTPTIRVEAPDRQPRPGRLFDVFPPMPFPEGRTQAVSYDNDICEFPNLAPGDCFTTIAGSSGPKTFHGSGTDTEGPLLALYAGIECYLSDDYSTYADTASNRIDMGASYAIENAIVAQVLAGGESGGTAANITAAIAKAEQLLIDNIPSQGIIMMSATNATLAGAAGVIEWDPLTGLGRTKIGTPVIATQSTPIGSQVIATGAIAVWEGDTILAEAPNQVFNRYRAIAERYYSFIVECGAWHIQVTAA